MKTMGFLISNKNNEQRRALLPEDVSRIENKDQILIEKGYGNSIHIDDEKYIAQGLRTAERSEVLKADILVDVKVNSADYLDQVSDHKILFGWAHVVQSIDFTTQVIAGKHTVYSWEEMYEHGRYLFYRNREIAGEAAVMQAFLHLGKMPYESTVAIIGNGQTARGAMRILHGLGATVDVYPRKLEKLFRRKMYEYDVLVNCVYWDTHRTDRLIYREDLKKMKPGTMIIDVSCDPYLEIETSHPTTIDNPVYEVDGIIHYAVDNTPAMFSKTASRILSNGLAPYFDQLITGEIDEILDKAKTIEQGRILDQETIDFRLAHGFNID